MWYIHNSKTAKMANQKSLNSTQVMTYNHNRHEILRKVSFSHCHLHSRWRSTPGTGHTSLCNICDKSPWLYCSCSLFSQHSCDVFEKRYIQDLHWDVRPGDDVRFPGWWDQALVCVWSPIGWCSCLSPCWKVSRHSHRQDQEYCITQYSTEKAENVYKVTWSDVTRVKWPAPPKACIKCGAKSAKKPY